MSDVPRTYDVAMIGYGPTGATAANLLGRLGLSVVVIERDPDIYGRARAISTDEEVLRIWQSVGLSDRLQADMLPDRPLAFVDAQWGSVRRNDRHRTRGAAIRRSSSSTSPPSTTCCARVSSASTTSRRCSSTNACGRSTGDDHVEY